MRAFRVNVTNALNQVVNHGQLTDGLVSVLLHEHVRCFFVRELADQFKEDLVGYGSILWVSFKHAALHDFAQLKG